MGEAAELLHRHRVVDEAPGAGVHAEVGADLAADAGREGGIVEDQLQRLLNLPLAQQVDAVLGGDRRRAGRLARCAVALILPVGNLQPVLAGVDQPGDPGVVVLDDVAEDPARHPLGGAEFAHRDAVVDLALLVGLGDDLAPLGEVAELGQQLRPLDLAKKDRQALAEEGAVGGVEIEQPDVVGKPLDRPAHVDGAADHAGAAAVAENRIELLAADAADDADAAAHELEGEGAGILQHPELRRVVGRVVLHQRARAGADAAGNVDLAGGGAVGGGVAAVAEDGQGRPGVEPAGVGRCRALDDDLGAVETEGADPLPGVFHPELERRAVLGPERTADVVVAGGEDLEFGLPRLQRPVDLLQQLLGGDALFLLVEADDLSHSKTPMEILNFEFWILNCNSKLRIQNSKLVQVCVSKHTESAAARRPRGRWPPGRRRGRPAASCCRWGPSASSAPGPSPKSS